MSPVRRLFWLSLCCVAAEAACFGGPTSDWPKEADGDGDGSEGPIDNGRPLDGGATSGGSKPRMDSSVIGPTPDACSNDADGGVEDAGASRAGILSDLADGGVPCR